MPTSAGAIWGVAKAIERLAKAHEEGNRLSEVTIQLHAAQAKVTAQLEAALATQITGGDDGSSDSA